MILDGLLQFSGPNGDSQRLLAFPSNVIDLHMAGIPILAAGQVPEIWALVMIQPSNSWLLVSTVFAGLTSLAVALQGAVDNGAGAPAAFTTWWTGPAVALAGLKAERRLYDMDMPRPPAGVAVPRFLQMSYTVRRYRHWRNNQSLHRT